MSREYCGTITYRDREYDVHWDNMTDMVYVTKIDNPLIENVNYDNRRAKRKEDAQNVAREMLITVLGKDYGSSY
jgi:hypothetical protein